MLFRSAANPNKGRGGNGASVTDQAIQALATLAWGKALLIVLGVGLILYAIFALANVHYKVDYSDIFLLAASLLFPSPFVDILSCVQ